MNKIFIFKGECDPYAFLQKQAAEKNNNTEIVRTKRGKPYFKYIPDLFFNVSNTQDVTVVVLSDCEVGIDIEKIRKPDFRIMKRFLKEEVDYITEADSDRRFFEIWTKKEAYLKCIGIGISGGLDSVNVLELPFETMDYKDYIISVFNRDKLK